MEKIKYFLTKYRGAIIGGIVAIVALLFNLHRIVLALLIILAGIFLGNYVQNNKEIVKEKLKVFIDKI